MCLICVEFNKKKMTREELKKALPEMIMFAKNEDEKKHYEELKKLGELSDESLLEEFTKTNLNLYVKKNK